MTDSSATSPINVGRVQASLNGVATYGTHEVAAYFYSHLWLQHPNTQAMFPEDMKLQREKLIKALAAAVAKLDEPERLTEYLKRLGHQHATRYRIAPFHYSWVGESFLATLEHFHSREDFYGPAWADVVGDWQQVYTFLSRTMIMGANEGRVTGADAEAALSPTSVSRMRIPRTFWPGGYRRADVERIRNLLTAIFEQAVSDNAELRRQLAEADDQIRGLRDRYRRTNSDLHRGPAAPVDDAAIGRLTRAQLAMEADGRRTSGSVVDGRARAPRR